MKRLKARLILLILVFSFLAPSSQTPFVNAQSNGQLPSVKDTVASDTTTSSTYEDIDGLSVSLTVNDQSDILLLASLQVSGSEAAQGGWRLVFDGTNYQSLERQIGSEPGNLMLTDLVSSKTSGTYTFKLQHKTSAGTLTTTNATIVAVSLHNGAGSVPANSSSVATDTVGTGWEDIPGLSTELTLSRTSHIWAIMTLCGYFDANNKDGNFAININNVRLEEHDRDWSGANEYGCVSIVTTTDSQLSSGTYTVKGEWAGSGGATLTGLNFTLVTIASEADDGTSLIDIKKSVVVSTSTTSTTFENVTGLYTTAQVNASAHVLSVMCIDTDVSTNTRSGYFRTDMNGTLFDALERGHANKARHGSVGQLARTDTEFGIGNVTVQEEWKTDSGNTLLGTTGVLTSIVLWAKLPPQSYERETTLSLSMLNNGYRPSWTLLRVVDQSLSATWNVLRSWTTSRLITQTISTTWDAYRDWTLYREVTQGLAFTWDAIGELIEAQQYLRELTLSLTHTWDLSRIWSTSRDLAQAFTFTWTPLREWTLLRILTQSLSFSWDSLREWVVDRSFSLSLTTIWNALREWVLLRTGTLSLTTSFDATRSWTLSRVFTQGLAFTWDAIGDLVTGQTYIRTVTLGITTTIEAIREWSLLRTFTQGITFTWDALGGFIYTRTATLGISFVWEIIETFIPSPPWSWLNVLVTNLDGEAILDSVVSVWSLDTGNLIFTEYTNSTGYIPRQNVTDGNYTITGLATNYLENMLKFNISVDRSLSLVLTHAEDAIMIPLPFFGFILLASTAMYIGWKQERPTESLWAYFFSLLFWVATMYQWNIDNGTSNPAFMYLFMFPILTLVFFIYEEATKYYDESMQGYKQDPFS